MMTETSQIKNLAIRLGVLLLVTFAVVANAKADTLTLASLGTALDPDQTNSTGKATIQTPQDPNWAAPLPGSAWVSFANTGNYYLSSYYMVPGNTVVNFYDKFNISGTPVSGSLQVRADNFVSVFLNGQQVFSAPAYTQHNTATPDLVTLTPYLQTGENTLMFSVQQAAAAQSFGLNYLGSVTFDGTGTNAPVPEPASMLLLGTGIAGMVARYRKGRSARATN
jgi:hypothetical protein